MESEYVSINTEWHSYEYLKELPNKEFFISRISLFTKVQRFENWVAWCNEASENRLSQIRDIKINELI